MRAKKGQSFTVKKQIDTAYDQTRLADKHYHEMIKHVDARLGKDAGTLFVNLVDAMNWRQRAYDEYYELTGGDKD